MVSFAGMRRREEKVVKAGEFTVGGEISVHAAAEEETGILRIDDFKSSKELEAIGLERLKVT